MVIEIACRVAQIFNLPYRRFLIGSGAKVPDLGICWAARRLKSAIRQIKNLRYAFDSAGPYSTKAWRAGR
jgi:hypothetical protein